MDWDQSEPARWHDKLYAFREKIFPLKNFPNQLEQHRQEFETLNALVIESTDLMMLPRINEIWNNILAIMAPGQFSSTPGGNLVLPPL